MIEVTVTMTTNSAPSPYVASASAEYDATTHAYRAFDNTAGGSTWFSGAAVPQWVKLDLSAGNATNVNRYTLTSQGGFAVRAPKDFKLQGSNDDAAWTDLDTQTNISWDNGGETKTYQFTNATSYRYYRLYISATASDNPEVGELHMYTEVSSASSSVSPSPSLSFSLSPSITPSSSVSLSPSPSPSLSPSLTPSSSISRSPSLSFSSSISLSPSLSASLSPSVTASLSPSATPSSSTSVSPSPGFSNYTRGDEGSLPGNDADLETTYSDAEEGYVEFSDNVRVGQTATSQYMLHQYKNFIGDNDSFEVTWEGRSTLAPSSSTVYLQIFNRDTAAWETIDSNAIADADEDFEISGEITDSTNYVNAAKVISVRVYQLSTP